MNEYETAFLKSFKAELVKKISESEGNIILNDKIALALYFIFLYEKGFLADFEKYKEDLIKNSKAD